MRIFEPKDLKKVPANAKRVFRGIIFDVYQWEQKLFDGSTGIFEMLKRPDSVQIIAIKDGKIVVLEEEQPNRGFFYTLPGGRHDEEDENELRAAQREMEEETGMRFSAWKLIHAIQPYSKIESVVYVFLATGFMGRQEQKLDAGEKITVTLKTFDEIKTLSKNLKSHNLAEDIFERLNSIQDLINLPECAA